MASGNNGAASGGGEHGSGIDPKNVPACLKSIKPYISRGSELENMALRAPGKMDYQRRAAYYCYLHALETGLEKMKGLETGPQSQEVCRGKSINWSRGPLFRSGVCSKHYLCLRRPKTTSCR